MNQVTQLKNSRNLSVNSFYNQTWELTGSKLAIKQNRLNRQNDPRFTNFLQKQKRRQTTAYCRYLAWKNTFGFMPCDSIQFEERENNHSLYKIDKSSK